MTENSNVESQGGSSAQNAIEKENELNQNAKCLKNTCEDSSVENQEFTSESHGDCIEVSAECLEVSEVENILEIDSSGNVTVVDIENSGTIETKDFQNEENVLTGDGPRLNLSGLKENLESDQVKYISDDIGSSRSDLPKPTKDENGNEILDSSENKLNDESEILCGENVLCLEYTTVECHKMK